MCAALGGIALSEKRQLKGYRVRLRVVEEVRRGDQFEDIQDSWPEEIVSVEALAVEP
jgi:hypothetical protein